MKKPRRSLAERKAEPIQEAPEPDDFDIARAMLLSVAEDLNAQREAAELRRENAALQKQLDAQKGRDAILTRIAVALEKIAHQGDGI